MQRLKDEGVEIVAWGKNDDDTPERAPYDYFGVFLFPNNAALVKYENTFRTAGWYDYFEQVNIGGSCDNFDSVLEQLISL